MSSSKKMPIQFRNIITLNPSETKNVILYKCNNPILLTRGRYKFTGTVSNYNCNVKLLKNREALPRNLVGNTNLSESEFTDLQINYNVGDYLIVECSNQSADIIEILCELEAFIYL